MTRHIHIQNLKHERTVRYPTLHSAPEFIDSFVHSFIQPLLRPCARSFNHSFVRSFMKIHAPVPLFVAPLTQSCMINTVLFTIALHAHTREPVHPSNCATSKPLNARHRDESARECIGRLPKEDVKEPTPPTTSDEMSLLCCRSCPNITN